MGLNSSFGEVNLDALDATIADNAVDIFIYDTSKDSDGGKWRKRTKKTSWYNEELNTTTRGSRREFPAVAVIVAENDKVTIYDGDDPDLPMWMVFNKGTGTYFSISANSCVTALNGKIVSGGNASNDRLRIIDFLSDNEREYSHTDGQRTHLSPISGRNSNDGFTDYDSSLPGVVNRYINDVAMTVLPNAPIDPTTQLPIPTIAAATNGGLSIIRDDGTVVDATPSSSAWYPTIVSTYGHNKFIMGNGSGTAGGYIVPVFNSDTTYNITSTPPSNGWLHFRSNGSNADIYLDLNENPATTGLPITALSSMGVGSAKGMNFFDVNDNSHSNSLVAYATSHYNTGWMHGDIKGAFLSDTDTTNVTGTELVTNGNFSSSLDTNVWINFYTSSNVATYSIVSGELEVVENNTNNYGIVSQYLTGLTVGKQYVISVDSRKLVGTARWFVGSLQGNDNYVTVHDTTSATLVTESDYWTATSTTAYINFAARYASGATAHFDNITVKEAEEDRSVNNNGLQVFGTITKSVVSPGAELVAYSGFNDSNYFEQPYNSNMQFGLTNDFSISFWMNQASPTTFSGIIDNGYSSSSNRYFIVGTDSNGKTFFRISGGGGLENNLTGSITVTGGQWKHITCVRTSNGTVTKIYVDGILDNTLTGTARDVSNTDNHQLTVGNRSNSTNRYFNGSMSLLRISASVPSPEQIKKMYEDEKFLFQENAKCTLYGSSDAVTALAYDDKTNLLHVGTSSGRSDFRKLRRINNTTTGITTAISASKGLIAEQ